MENEELPEKIKALLEGLSEMEGIFDESFPDDDIPWDYPWYIWHRHHNIFDPVHRRLGEGQEINIIPPRYGEYEKCTDTLLVFVEPSFWILQGDECHPEMRLKKRIESAMNFIDRCGNARYIVFWSSIWEFRMWKKYEKQFSGKVVILKPWGFRHIILK
jgi:hypothetical protein